MDRQKGNVLDLQSNMTGPVVVTLQAKRDLEVDACAWSKDYGGTVGAKAGIGKVRGGEDAATPWASGRRALGWPLLGRLR